MAEVTEEERQEIRSKYSRQNCQENVNGRIR